MIKRSGVEIKNAKTIGKQIAQSVLKIIQDKCYTASQSVDISSEVDASIKGTVLYQEPILIKEYEKTTPQIVVTNETTSQAGLRLLQSGKTDIVALNFSSGRNPGGGFLSGAIAQEEDLCRASTLYSCLLSKPNFYKDNIRCKNTLYTDNIIYSPKVPFFKDEEGNLLDSPFLLSIISAPAPNVRSLDIVDHIVTTVNEINSAQLHKVLLNRAIKILQVAEVNNHKNIILGAWGCGAFGNNVNMVADIFKTALEVVPTFQYVHFAVYDTRDGLPIFNIFKSLESK